MVMQHPPPFRPIAVNTPLSRRDLLRCCAPGEIRRSRHQTPARSRPTERTTIIPTW